VPTGRREPGIRSRLTTKTTTRFADSPHGRGETQVQDTSTVAVYARLRTPAQVARANRLNEELYGAMYAIKSVHYPPRAYMAPASRMGAGTDETLKIVGDVAREMESNL
jgi:hypothetical protein